MPRKLLGAAAEFARRRFGGDIGSIEDQVTVTTSPTRLVGNDPERVSLQIINGGATDIFVGFRPNVSSSTGIRLSSGGSLYSVNAEEDVLIPTYAHFAVSASGSPVVEIFGLKRINIEDVE